MHNIGNYLLLALTACCLWQGSLANDSQSDFVCLFDDPEINQCDSFCLTELRPLLKQVVKAQDRRIPCDAYNKTITKLENLEVKMEEVQTQLEKELRMVQTKVEEAQTKLEESLHAVQNELKTQLQAILNRIESQLQAVPSNMEVPKQAANVEPSDLVMNTIPSDFEKIGTRYFLLQKERASWETAKRRCRELGGFLASFQTKGEFIAIAARIQKKPYWLGIHDQDTEGHFISVTTQKPPKFVYWSKGQPSDKNHRQNCVVLQDGEMADFDCSSHFFYICQADNEN